MNLRLFAVALTALLSFVTAVGQNSRDRFDQSRYLEAILPPELRRFAGIEVPSEENIRVLSENRMGVRKVSTEHLAAWPVSAQAADSRPVEKVVGMYVHQH